MNKDKLSFIIKFYLKYYITAPLSYLLERGTKPKFYRDIAILIAVILLLNKKIILFIIAMSVAFSFHVWNKIRAGEHNKAYLEWMIKKSKEKEED